MKKYILFSVMILSLLVSCQGPTDSDTGAIQVKVIMSTDSQFSALSKEKGMKAAFLYHIDSNAVLLRPGHYPIIGKDAVQYLQNQNDTSFSLTWAPQSCEMAKSADIGYTYGVYTFESKDTSFQGTYVSIWKRQADGSWKFTLDTGNPGVDQKK